jgi:hypothetical protein
MTDATSLPEVRPPSRRARFIIALFIGVAASLFAGMMAARPGAVPDLLYPLTAARHLLNGVSPYAAMPGVRGAPPPYDLPQFYPLTAAIALTPLAGMPTPLAVGLFFGLSSALLAYFLTREELWRVHLFASAPFVVAASLGQFSPLVTVAALVPWAGALCTLKPNLGLAILLRQPSRALLVSCAAFGILSLAISPHWLAEWLGGLRGDAGSGRIHEIPFMQPAGYILVLSLLAVRRADGRLLAAMSLLPQLLFFYDQLPLFLAARTRRQSIALTACSQAGMIAWWLTSTPGDPVVRSAYPFVLASSYLPALVVVLLNAKRAPDQESGARSPSAESRLRPS